MWRGAEYSGVWLAIDSLQAAQVMACENSHSSRPATATSSSANTAAECVGPTCGTACEQETCAKADRKGCCAASVAPSFARLAGAQAAPAADPSTAAAGEAAKPSPPGSSPGACSAKCSSRVTLSDWIRLVPRWKIHQAWQLPVQHWRSSQLVVTRRSVQC